MKRVFEAPLHYLDGKQYVKVEELTKKDISKIQRIIMEDEMKKTFISKIQRITMPV